VPVPQLERNNAVVVDILGTGQPGIFWSRRDFATGRTVHQFLSFGMVPEHRMLVEVQGDLGHKTLIVYGTSSSHRERDVQAGRHWTTFLPFSLPVVNRVENIDAPAGVRAVTNYTYHNGHFDGIERSFNGFGEVHEETAGDESTPGIRVETQFHPGADIQMTEAQRRQLDPNIRLADRALKGSALKIERYEQKQAKPTRLLDRTVNRLSARVDFEGPAGRVLTPFSIDSITDEPGELESRRTIVRHGEPDAFVNPTWTEFEAGVVSSDSAYQRTNLRRDVIDYVDSNATTDQWWLPGLVSQRTTLDAGGQALSCVRFYYDGPDFEGLDYGLADRGILRRIEELVARQGESEYEDDMAHLGHHLLTDPSVRVPGWYRNRSRTRNAATGQVLAARDPAGNETQIEYDAWGIDPIRTIDAAQLTTLATYDYACERISSVTNPSGMTERRVYDALGRTRQVMRTGSLGSLDLVAVVRHEYGDFHDLQAGETPPSIITIVPWSAGRSPHELESTPLTSIREVTIARRFYSSSGLELETVSTGATQDTTLQLQVHSGERTFSRGGKVVAEGRPRFAEGFSMLGRSGAALPYRRVYDTVGREVTSTFPRGKREQQFEPLRTLIADANVVAASSPPGVERVFDGFGRLVTTRERISCTVTATHSFEYTVENWLAAIRGTEGDLLVEYSFDRLGRRTRASHRDAGEYGYIYDAAGNLVQTQHATGGLINFGYDTIQRLVRVEHLRPDGTLESIHRLSYDRSPDGTSICGGRVCAIEDDSGLTVLDYASDGRLSAKRRTTPEGRQLVLRFEYNFRGLLSTITYPDGTRVSYEYGPEGEITKIDGFVDAITYDERGRPVLIVYANWIQTHITYDETERPSVIESRRNGNLLARFEQSYDRVGNPTRVLSRVDGAPEEERSLEYDLLNRLIRSVGRRGIEAFDYDFEYDAAGNILTNPEHGIEKFLFEDAPHPGRLTGLIRSGAPAERLRSYDAAGRLTSTESLARIVYNLADRLVHAVTREGHRQSVVYDLYGHRAQSTVQLSDGTVNTSLVFDDLYEESGDERVIRVKGIGGLVAVIRRRAAVQSLEVSHHDPQGNVRFITDRNGAVLARFSYTSFGLDMASLRVGGAFTGKEVDPILGFIQLGVRYFEPLTGRFTTPDLLLIERPNLALSDPSQFNLYAYALNNPYRYRDPHGRFVWLIVAAGVLIGGTIGYMAAKENGQNPWLGALIGGVVGGLTGAAGLLGEALIGAVISGGGAWLSGATSKEIWTGAAVGFAFGALGGAVSSWTPVVGGLSTGAKVANAFIEIATTGLTSGLAAGTSNAVMGRSFEDGFKSGLMMGAALGAARVALIGVRFDPSSINNGFHSEAAKAFEQQNQWDKYNFLSSDVAKAGMPDPSRVTFRTGGLINLLNGDRSFAIGKMVQTDAQAMDELRNGSAWTLAHELRHIGQQAALTFGSVEFLVIWLFQGITDQHQYEVGPQNRTLEPHY
jgi:RHS repeat-associated protein